MDAIKEELVNPVHQFPIYVVGKAFVHSSEELSLHLIRNLPIVLVGEFPKFAVKLIYVLNRFHGTEYVVVAVSTVFI